MHRPEEEFDSSAFFSTSASKDSSDGATIRAANAPLHETSRVTDVEENEEEETEIPVELRVPSVVLTITPSYTIDPSSGRALFNPRVSKRGFTESETLTV